MRISDWSSDVCSSDLYGGSPVRPCRRGGTGRGGLRRGREGARGGGGAGGGRRARHGLCDAARDGRGVAGDELGRSAPDAARRPRARAGANTRRAAGEGGRQNVVEGKTVSVRVESGGCRNT